MPHYWLLDALWRWLVRASTARLPLDTLRLITIGRSGSTCTTHFTAARVTCSHPGEPYGPSSSPVPRGMTTLGLASQRLGRLKPSAGWRVLLNAIERHVIRYGQEFRAGKTRVHNELEGIEPLVALAQPI